MARQPPEAFTASHTASVLVARQDENAARCSTRDKLSRGN